MFYQAPTLLWLLLALPLLPVAYVWILRSRRKQAVRYSSVAVVRAAASKLHWKRHVPPALLFVALSILAFASARPVAKVPLPWSRSTVILAIDVSLSMRVSDVKPTRLAAAQDAAKAFLDELPKGVEVGLVTFAGSSQVLQRATMDRDAIKGAIDAFQMQMGTAVGNAIVLSLAELFPDHGLDVGHMTFGNNKSVGRSLDEKEKRPPKEITPVKPGSYESAAIILLSDGRRTTGVDTLTAAKMAADRGVRVYVVGLGTVGGDAATPEGMPIYLQLDEPTLREVARMTDGEYHHAGTAEHLRTVYEKLGSRVQVDRRETEITGLLTLAAAVVAATAALLSVAWFNRLG